MKDGPPFNCENKNVFFLIIWEPKGEYTHIPWFFQLYLTSLLLFFPLFDWYDQKGHNWLQCSLNAQWHWIDHGKMEPNLIVVFFHRLSLTARIPEYRTIYALSFLGQFPVISRYIFPSLTVFILLVVDLQFLHHHISAGFMPKRRDFILSVQEFLAVSVYHASPMLLSTYKHIVVNKQRRATIFSIRSSLDTSYFCVKSTIVPYTLYM